MGFSSVSVEVKKWSGSSQSSKCREKSLTCKEFSKFCSIGALIETSSVLNCFKVAVRLNNIVCSCSSPKHFWSLLLIVLKKTHSEAIIFLIYILTLKVIKPILIKGSLEQKSRRRTCVEAFTVPSVLRSVSLTLCF